MRPLNAAQAPSMAAAVALAALLLASPEGRGAPPSASPFIRTIAAIEPDPDETLFKTHYLTSNERHHALTFDALHGAGGVFIGIGTDQNFLLIPRLRPTHVVMLDFDQWVADAHTIYRHLFITRETPQAFIDFFSPAQQRAAKRELDTLATSEAERAQLERIYARYREQIYTRLLEQRKRLHLHKAQGYLNHQADYDVLRDLARRGRYAALRGDLTGDASLTGLAAALRSMNLRVGTLSLSNAEQYFDYTAAFRRNMHALPYTSSALVLRTFRHKGRRYDYYRQSAADFLPWLQSDRARNIRDLIAVARPLSHPLVHALPAPKGCGYLTAQGRCDGAHLSFCLSGSPQVVACDATAPAGCGWSDAAQMYRCGEATGGPMVLDRARP